MIFTFYTDIYSKCLEKEFEQYLKRFLKQTIYVCSLEHYKFATLNVKLKLCVLLLVSELVT